jgi:hypothetical protein
MFRYEFPALSIRTARTPEVNSAAIQIAGLLPRHAMARTATPLGRAFIRSPGLAFRLYSAEAFHTRLPLAKNGAPPIFRCS